MTDLSAIERPMRDLYAAILREYHEAFETNHVLNANVIASLNELAYTKIDRSNMFDTILKSRAPDVEAPDVEAPDPEAPGPIYIEVGDEVDF